MTVTRSKILSLRVAPAALLGVLAAAFSAPSSAFELELFDTPIKIDNLFTVGGMWRTQDRDSRLIGKSTLYRMEHPGMPGFCVARLNETAAGPNPDPALNEYRGDTCTTSVPASNVAYVNLPGAYSPNGDNGNLNFEKYDIVHATAKLTTDISFTAYDFNVFVRPIYFFDSNYSDFTERHPDTTLQASENPFSPKAEDLVGSRFDVLDYNISKVFTLGSRDVSVKIGNQVLNWGESALLFLNSLNTINPPNATRARIPGFDLKEAFQPQGMIVLGTDIVDNVSLETFYQYDWKPLIIDPVGSFFSVSDTLGAGGKYAMLSFGKAPEDPDNIYRPYLNDGSATAGGAPDTNNDDPIGALGSTAGRTVYRNSAEEAARLPDDGGQYGAALKLFLEDFNNGTELAFYAANYHSRLPVVSAIAAQATCLDSTIGAASLPGACAYAGPYQPAGNEPIPVDSMSLIVEYPESIKLYGLSFNTTIGDYAFSGEYAFRPNLPIQVHTVDLTYTALQPAFPAGDITVAPGTVIPGRQSAFPTFLTGYRGFACTTDANCIQPGQYIRGYESLKVGQTGLTVLRLIGGDNPIGASQMTLLMEMGWTQVMGMPGLDKIQFQGAGVDTHISGGGDGTVGYEPPAVANNTRANTLRQNPTAVDPDNFGDANSYGYRIINLNRWDSAFLGANVETLSIIQHDVKGTTPGIGGNFVEGRKQYAFGLRADYLSTYIAEIRYTWFTGAGDANSTIDRDNVFVTFGVQF